jgi:hypothetical protein
MGGGDTIKADYLASQEKRNFFRGKKEEEKATRVQEVTPPLCLQHHPCVSSLHRVSPASRASPIRPASTHNSASISHMHVTYNCRKPNVTDTIRLWIRRQLEWMLSRHRWHRSSTSKSSEYDCLNSVRRAVYCRLIINSHRHGQENGAVDL